MESDPPMLSFLPSLVKGPLAAAWLGINTLFWCLLLYPLAAAKALIPIRSVRKACTRSMVAVAESWIAINNFGLDLFHGIQWSIDGLGDLKPNRSYLVCANHQSW